MMKSSKLRLKIILILLVVGLVILREVWRMSDSGTLKVTYLDVGQGDSILIQTPRGGRLLIDTGKDARVLEQLGRELGPLENEIDLVIGTHDDLDHVGGLPSVLEKYKVDSLLLSLPESKNETIQAAVKLTDNKKIKLLTQDTPNKITTSDGVTIENIFPVTYMKDAESNSASIVTRVRYGGITFLMTGDLGVEGEGALIKYYNSNLKSSVLKLGHHGSDTSSSPEFIKTVSPLVAIVSAGKDNSYGHPHESVIKLVKNFEIEILSTAQDGSIHLETDGVDLWRN